MRIDILYYQETDTSSSIEMVFRTSAELET